MRCYIPADQWNATRLVAHEDEAHHLLHVLRVKPGQPLEAFDGRGRVAEVEVESVQKHRVEMRVVQQRDVPRPAVFLTLVQAMPREQKMDLVLQKGVELGVGAIVPLLTRHSLIRLGKDAGEAKHDRWDRIAINAAKQCGTAWLPAIAQVQTFEAWLAAKPAYDLLLCCSLEADARPLRDVLQSAKARGPKSIAFLIGPEGDFSREEHAAIRHAGARAVTFGDLVLRTETAALYALSALKYEFC